MKTVLFVLLLLSGFGAGAQALPAEASEILAETQGAQAVLDVSKSGKAAEAAVIEAKAETKTEAKADVPAKPLKESEIPLHLDKKKNEEAGGGSALRFLFGFAVLGTLLGGAWYLVRKHSKPGPKKNAPQIKVLTQHHLGPKKSLAIIRVAGESILIGVTDHNINLIKPLSLIDDEVPAEAPAQFENVLTGMGMKDKEIEEDNEGEEFQMSGLGQIRDAVGRRLKNMRSLE